MLTLEDLAEAAHAVVLHLDIDQLHAVVGCSMGGMSGLAYCVRHPQAVRSFVSISSTTRAEPFSIAVRSLQREMIRSDPKWLDGDYDPADPPVIGQRLARKLGMITYRSAEEWDRNRHRSIACRGRLLNGWHEWPCLLCEASASCTFVRVDFLDDTRGAFFHCGAVAATRNDSFGPQVARW